MSWEEGGVKLFLTARLPSWDASCKIRIISRQAGRQLWWRAICCVHARRNWVDPGGPGWTQSQENIALSNETSLNCSEKFFFANWGGWLQAVEKNSINNPRASDRIFHIFSQVERWKLKNSRKSQFSSPLIFASRNPNRRNYLVQPRNIITVIKSTVVVRACWLWRESNRLKARETNFLLRGNRLGEKLFSLGNFVAETLPKKRSTSNVIKANKDADVDAGKFTLPSPIFALRNPIKRFCEATLRQRPGKWRRNFFKIKVSAISFSCITNLRVICLRVWVSCRSLGRRGRLPCLLRRSLLPLR